MATENKDFRVKNGLVVQGTTATVNGNSVLTSASNIDDLADVDTTGVADGNALAYDSATSTWKPTAAGGTPASASTTVAGIVELATDAEAQAESDTGIAITPSNLAAWSPKDIKNTGSMTQKVRIWVQSSEPSSGMQEGDLWFYG